VSRGDPRPANDSTLTAERSSRTALWAFVAVVLVAFPLFVYLGGYRWFLFDEWAFLADRDGGNLGDLLRPHASTHW
jgi:hypothetical protein